MHQVNQIVSTDNVKTKHVKQKPISSCKQLSVKAFNNQYHRLLHCPSFADKLNIRLSVPQPQQAQESYFAISGDSKNANTKRFIKRAKEVAS